MVADSTSPVLLGVRNLVVGNLVGGLRRLVGHMGIVGRVLVVGRALVGSMLVGVLAGTRVEGLLVLCMTFRLVCSVCLLCLVSVEGGRLRLVLDLEEVGQMRLGGDGVDVDGTGGSYTRFGGTELLRVCYADAQSRPR